MAYQSDGRGSRQGSGRDRGSAQRAVRPASVHSHEGGRPRQGRDLRGSQPRAQRSDGAYRSSRNYRSLTGHDTGYTVRNNKIGFNGRRNSNRNLILLLGAIVVLIILILVISSCVRGCSSAPSDDVTAEQQGQSVNELDSRVAAGVSDELTKEFSTRLDQDETLAQIASNAASYGDERVPELAILEPDAVSFVASVPTAEKKSSTYDDAVSKGTFPKLFDWDVRWGYVDYAGSILGVTGSGPTSLSMAYMGLSGNTDKTPADIAQAAADGGYAKPDDALSTSADFLDGLSGDLGLSVRSYKVSSDNLATVFSNYDPGEVCVIVQLKSDFTTPYAHWALLPGTYSDGSYQLYDPTSSEASSHGWSAGTIAANADAFYALTYTGQASSDSADASSDSE